MTPVEKPPLLWLQSGIFLGTLLVAAIAVPWYGLTVGFHWSAWLAFIVYGLGCLVFLLMLAPAALIVYLMPGAWTAGGFIFALLFAWSVKAALLEPFAITCMMQVYFKTIEGQQPNPEWEAKLEQMSGKFRKLKERAFGAAGESTAQPEAVP